MNTPPPARTDLPTTSFGAFRPLLLLLAAMGIAYAAGLHQHLSFERLAANRVAIEAWVGAHSLLAVVGYMLVYALTVALSLPVASFLTIFGGFVFGPFVGGSLTVVAATAGALAVFLIARSSFGETLQSRAGPTIEKLRTGFAEHALNYLLFLRLVPLFPFWLVNIAPALLGVSAPIFVIATFIGIIPATYAFAWVGAGLGSVIDAQLRAQAACLERAAAAQETAPCPLSLDPGALLTGELTIALVALGCVALIPVALKKLKRS